MATTTTPSPNGITDAIHGDDRPLRGESLDPQASEAVGRSRRGLGRSVAAAGAVAAGLILARRATRASRTRKARAGVKVVGGAYRAGRVRGRMSPSRIALPTPDPGNLHLRDRVRAGLSTVGRGDVAIERVGGTLHVRAGEHAFTITRRT